MRLTNDGRHHFRNHIRSSRNCFITIDPLSGVLLIGRLRTSLDKLKLVGAIAHAFGSLRGLWIVPT